MRKITKSEVARGIYWVEIPDVGLRILCGCPMDSVKHLMKRGLIIPTEIKGVPCETGPNAILLSDIMLQNGEFSNLGEFPVLQMLYKQGLIIPNHPNNTGKKPLLIGQAEQVYAQMQYIYRGNYGLVSKEEIMATGVDSATADEMMRLKLKFAFGAIRPTQDLLDSCIVGDGDVEIRDGVMIRRKETNVFELEYRGEKVFVDLHLNEGKGYESAYPLGYQRISREYFGIIHSGEGDGWDINRPSMSSILMFQGKVYLIDAGPNLDYNLSTLGIGIDEIEGIFHTHAHDDHFTGVTTLMRAGHKIKYFATRLVRATVEKKVAALLSIEERQFEEFFDVQDLAVDTWNSIEGFDVKPVNSPHPLETTILVFRTLWEDGYKTYAHFADIVSLDVLKKMIEDDLSKPGITQDYFDRVQAEYLTPVNLKKLDVGGGMIHGVARDFREDKSGRILLSHMARELTPEEKEIGTNAPHGMMDILISGESDFARRNAFSYLTSALPNIPLYQLRILINNPIIDFNPGVVLFKEGDIPQHIYLILTGTVERIRTSEGLYSRQSGGALIGELAGLYSQPTRSTYRATGFVRALKISVALYRELVDQNNLMPRIEQTWENRSFLESTSLFSEGIPYQTFGKIVDSIHVRTFNPGDMIVCKDLTLLNIVRRGRVGRSIGGKQTDILEMRDFFGEEGAVFNTPCLFRLEALEVVETLQIPGELLGEIPIVRWKLFETYLNRARLVVHSDENSGAFRWNTAFDIQIMEMDTHHKKLIEIANAIVEILRTGQDKGSLELAFESLIDYTRYHFKAEEDLMERYGYPDLDQHRNKHCKLVERVLEYRESLRASDDYQQIDFKGFLTYWLIRHILNVDRQYGAFLHSRGVY
ncbi:MAG: bacteriohemerythrin [Magnetococcales bacterium]|nr:bacteriohemerythrin [Magnetococcales bacterium]